MRGMCVDKLGHGRMRGSGWQARMNGYDLRRADVQVGDKRIWWPHAKMKYGPAPTTYQRELLSSLDLGDVAPSDARGTRASALRRRGTRTRLPKL